MVNGLWVFLGGGIGAAARYLLSGWIHELTGSTFPYGTFTENALGCFLIGLFMTGPDEHFLVDPSLRIFLTIGVLGGFTTFSTFSYETISMMRDAEYFFASVNIASTLVACLGATYLGALLGKVI
ncbi:MAG TPA: fluoride efflux transporter CrcB [Bacteroidota bacterium]|jgi:CrcB protein|nr:fluoride efflux transporter CrcB [Bacteroidota bacterium]